MEFGAIKLCELEATEFGFAERRGFGNKESGELDVTALRAVDSGATKSCTSEVAKLGATEFCKSEVTEFGATESVVESCTLSKQGPEATLPLAHTEGPVTLEPANNLRRGG